ncbi:hypothetical protein M441DRAFT_72780 [Trichoderma asperellum CBS 433.97]|uniref:Argininosuccinate lyase n=1 Tax=Trichoderma asperellum (strain ATCC 204424 / CBS 433.97 / NBRC 101777) TaxID=1042311 RepID=A0A2T3YVW0_TRIA4|nr:hypothetical protein M441DRAFT_72780 [Trichoderma asperellum CBS 433.97]PTB36705.1 hypothetical protein M441DRAFT_72780 [Trichoderma asperellum CBS 433.97]
MASTRGDCGAMLGGGWPIHRNLDPLIVKKSESIHFDRILYKQDVAGSIAFARSNAKAGIVTQEEFKKLKQGLRELHTNRGHSEQVVRDMRMWLCDELRKIEEHQVSFLNVIAARAEQEIDCRVQPIRWSHWILPFGFAFASDLERLGEVIERINRNHLGCGALTGNPFGIDRDIITTELGLDVGAMFMQHISRWAEDLIIYSAAEFGFVRLSEAYSTESSLKPQNPDIRELIRGKCIYNKDLQQSIEPMADHVNAVSDGIQNANGMKATLDSPMLVTDVADYLVRKGVPFRETHHISSRYVAKSEETSIPMNELSFEQLQAIDSRFEEDIAEAFVY